MNKFLFTAVAALALYCSQAKAADHIPQQFVGSWCVSKSQMDWDGTIYNRSNTCKSAHEPEGHLIFRSNRMLITGLMAIDEAIECKFLEIVSITRHGTHRLKFWCKSNQSKDVPPWTYEILVSTLRSKLALQVTERSQ
jgi:hypothetical protein